MIFLTSVANQLLGRFFPFIIALKLPYKTTFPISITINPYKYDMLSVNTRSVVYIMIGKYTVSLIPRLNSYYQVIGKCADRFFVKLNVIIFSFVSFAKQLSPGDKCMHHYSE